MIDNDRQQSTLSDGEEEIFPVEPRYHPLHRIPRYIYDFLASAKLAMALLIIILICCVLGVTVWRGIEAGRVIFGAIWFNAILVLLVINIACCFFGRIWRRRVTTVSFGMILFHLSFVVMLLAIIYNSLFFFRGTIRLTEGESLPSSDKMSYDLVDAGRFFSFSRLKGETTLIKMHTGYKIGGEDKRAAYEVAIGEPELRKQGVIYVTHKLTDRGVDYFNDKEGYSLLLMLSDKKGNDLYGVHVPLQSLVVGKDTYKYFTGSKVDGAIEKDVIPFPAPPEKVQFAVQAEYTPSKDIQERGGDVLYTVYGLDTTGMPDYSKPLAVGNAPVGKSFAVGDYVISAKEVRFWVGMLVRYEPGKPILLASLWVAFAGLVITTVGRMLRSQRTQR